MDSSPQDQVAQLFMERKGYYGARPKDVQKIEGDYCWYYLYDLQDGRLELEVSWDGREWQTMVTAFSVAN